MLPRSPGREVALVYGGVTAATFAITRMRAVAFVSEYVHVAVAALFLVVAVRLAQREEGGVRRFGIDLGGVLSPPAEEEAEGPLGLVGLVRATVRALPSGARESLIAIAIALVVFPPFALGFYLWHRPGHPFHLVLPSGFASIVLAHLFVVALPEEALFRGYFQTRLGDVWTRRHRVLGAEVSLIALAGQAVLFAILHFLVDLDPRRLAVFFPGLLFGWLREARGGIGAPIVLHALSNIYIDVLARGWQ